MKRYYLALLCCAASWGLFLSPSVLESIGFLSPMAALGSSLIGLLVAFGALSHGEKPRWAAMLSCLLNLAYPLFFAALLVRQAFNFPVAA